MAKRNVTVTSTLSKQWVGKTDRAIDIAVLTIATDIDKRAKILAPHESGALINSSQIERLGSGHYAVSYGGGDVPYAKRRHFENKKNPQTIGYLAKAGDSVARSSLTKYIRKP